MDSRLAQQNAVIAIRVSTTKQGTDGDSPEAQREQLIRYAETHGVAIKETFIFLESGSKEEQPMQQAINYCKDPKNNIQLLIIKSIDRFTRGGGSPYDQLKLQLERINVQLVDIYGVISSQRVNTLEHLGIEYSWSKYSPSQKTEYLEAERAKDELRDILSRMIGAEVRYARLGYWMRRPPYGFISEKVETKNGKRCILQPHPIKAPLMMRMFELRAQGILRDQEIVDELNKLGFKTRVRFRRSKQDRTRVISQSGGDPLTVKAMWKLIHNPIYAGVNVEKWTNNEPVRCVFDGLVEIELFNQANKGKFGIIDNGENLSLYTKQPPAHLINKGIHNADFPYRKFVGCSVCGRPMLGSASRGRNGTLYPAYHCSNHGHYFRVPKKELEDSIVEFIGHIQVPQQHADLITEAVMAEWGKRQQSAERELTRLDEHNKELQLEAKLTVKKMKFLQSETALTYMEEDLMRIEQEITTIKAQRVELQTKKPTDIRAMMARVKYFLENMDKLLLQQIDPVRRAQFFGVLFDRTPTYAEINPGNKNSPIFTGVNSLFSSLAANKSLVVNYLRSNWNAILLELRDWYTVLAHSTTVLTYQQL